MATIPDNQGVNTTNSVMQRIFRMLQDYESSNRGNFFDESRALYDMQDIDERIIVKITAENDGVYDCIEVGKTDDETTLDSFTQAREFNSGTIQIVEATGLEGVPIDTIAEIFLRYSPDGTFQWYFIAGGSIDINNCTLPIAEDAEPQTNEEQDAEAPGCLMVDDDFDPRNGTYRLRRLQSEPASSGQAEVPVVLDEEGCIIKIGAVDIGGGDTPYDQVNTVKGDKKWIAVTNVNNAGVNTAVVSHINQATVHTTITLATTTSLGVDKTGHIIEVDGSSIIDDDDIPDITDCGPFPIFTDDTLIAKVADVIITGFLYDTGTTNVVTTVCPFDIYDVLFHLEKPVSTPFTTYDGSTGVIQAFIVDTNVFCKWTDGDDIRTSIAVLADATNHGIEASPELLIPPSAYDSGSVQIKITYNVPIVSLCTSTTVSVCALESNLLTKEGDADTIAIDSPANYDFYMDIGGTVHGLPIDYTGRYKLECTFTYGLASTLLSFQEIITFTDITIGVTDFPGVAIVLAEAAMDGTVSEGEEICLNVKVFDLEFNDYVTAWEQDLCRNYIAFCWSDLLIHTSLNDTRWSETKTNASASYTAGGIDITKTGTSNMDYYILNNLTSFNTTFLCAIDFNSTYGVSTGSEFERACGLRIKIGGVDHWIVASKGEGTVLGPADSVGIYVEIAGTKVYNEILAVTSGTLAITRDGADLVEFKIDGVVKWSVTKAGIVSAPLVDVNSSTNTQNPFTSNLSNFVIESPIGTPYCT